MIRYFFFSFIIIFSCSGNKLQNTGESLSTNEIQKTISQMKFSGYTELWEKVKTFEKHGQTKSALRIVEQIYKLAKADRDGAQIVKALLYQSKYMMILEENARLKIIRNFEKEIKENKPPVTNVLESYLAQIYWQYYRENRWKFAHRTETAAVVDSADFRTWDLQTLIKTVSLHFERSLQHPALLQAFPLDKWRNIVELNKQSLKYRPTLYDLLVHEALNFYENKENSLTAPAYQFSIDKPEFLSDTETFVKLDIKSDDNHSLTLKALHLYQDYLKFRLKSKNIDALAMADYERLKFVYDNAVFPDKDEVFLQTVQFFLKDYHLSDVSAMMLYQKALILNNLGGKYQENKDEKYRWKKKEAVSVCQTAIDKYPESVGAKRCERLLYQIKSKSVSIKVEKQIPENRPALYRIDYHNTNKLTLFIYKLTPHSRYDALQKTYERKEKQKLIEYLPLVKKQEVNLTDPGDFQPHSTERILPELPNGEYILMLKAAKDNQWGYSYVQVTDVALQHLNGNGNTFFVVDRNNGKKVQASVEIKKRKYNNNWIPYKHLKTGSKGDFILQKPSRDYYEYSFIITYDNNKKAYFQDYLTGTPRHTTYRTNYKAFIFTDRSIYRPGQNLYFKSIILEQLQNRSAVLKDLPVTVDLYDANRQKISSLQLKTNEYGSVQGSFVLPAQTLTGNFRLEIHSNDKTVRNSRTFKVEEYKRPKFEVRFNPVEGEFKVNETVKITGIAESFAGSRISDAKVVYRVKRKVQMPRWWYWYRPDFGSKDQEIAHGQVKTDAQGNFVIRFNALPDVSVQAENQPVFHYEVYAEVMDINGETHSATTTVKAGYQSLQANIIIPGQINRKQPDTIRVETRNLNGQAVGVKGKLEIYKLQAPDRVLRPRPWQIPEFQEINEKDFIRKFPHTAYKKQETNFHNWEKGKLYLKLDFDTSQSEKMDFGNINNWETGKYVAILTTKDKEGNTISDKSFFELTDFTQAKIADNAYVLSIQNKEKFKPGEKLIFKIGSAAKGNIIKVWVEKQRKIILEKQFTSDGTYKTVEVPVDKNDFGGFALHYNITAFNHNIFKTVMIDVPFPSDQLQVETIHFRDKLLPGQQEQWRFRIKGPNGDKVAAEVLASMYDASLDKLIKHEWDFHPVTYRYYRPFIHFSDANSFANNSFNINNLHPYVNFGNTEWIWSRLRWFSFSLGQRYYRKSLSNAVIVANDYEGAMPVAEAKADAVKAFGQSNKKVTGEVKPKEKKEEDLQVSPRKNLQETAFFYPQLYTDEAGNVSFAFTIPEALTKWKLQLLAHTPGLKYAYKTLFAQTQKDIMVFPNAPRFVREGDRLIFSAKISNMTEKNISGTAQLILIDALTGKNIDDKLIVDKTRKDFQIDSKSNTQMSWTLQIPGDVQAIQYKILAKAGNQTDGEQNLMPVLSNRMLVTETMPLWVRSNQNKTFVMSKLLHHKSKTLKNHRLTLEITSNPAWYAVQALPYLMEYPYECSEQTFSRFYANALASHIANSQPKIKKVFDLWKNQDSKALLSALEKNQELKSLIIEETPWLRDAQSESEQKKRIGLLFDLNKMSYQLQKNLEKLHQLQLSGGGFTWFKGGRYPNRYITQHIVAGFGHLKHLNVDIHPAQSSGMIRRAVEFLDNEIAKDYDKLKKSARKNPKGNTYLDEFHTGAFQIHYLYARSFFTDIKMPDDTRKAVEFYLKQAEKYWLSYGLYTKGLLAMVSHRNGHLSVAKEIIRSLDENSITNEELGMYWKENTAGYYWYQAPIETQAVLIEAFDEINGNVDKIDEMRIWLLKNKQTTAWKTTKQTTEAVYALLLRGTDWLSLENNVSVQIGKLELNPAQMPEIKTEAGTGYFKKSWQAGEIKPEMAKVQIRKTGKGIAWGGLYWQYFENLDKINFAGTPLQIEKKLFIRKFTDTGEKMYPVDENTKLKVGDLIRVRIVIKVDRDMEYIHLKDMRASGFEPVNVLSAYRWQDGLGYYESTRDASTNFFIGYLRKGVYVFEYDLRANNAGDFSNGITTIQCMYAPEFSSHSEGIRVKIEK